MFHVVSHAKCHLSILLLNWLLLHCLVCIQSGLCARSVANSDLWSGKSEPVDEPMLLVVVKQHHKQSGVARSSLTNDLSESNRMNRDGEVKQKPDDDLKYKELDKSNQWASSMDASTVPSQAKEYSSSNMKNPPFTRTNSYIDCKMDADCPPNMRCKNLPADDDSETYLPQCDPVVSLTPKNSSDVFAVDINTARTIYEMTMIFVSCCLGLILFVFVVCILKKAYCSPRTSRRTSPNHMDGGGMQDMFGLCSDQHQNASGVSNDQFFPYSINVPFEKPPTYEETLRIMRCEIGVPPPEYQGDGGSGALTNASTMISMDVARSSITAHVQNVDTQTTLPAATGTATGTASNRRSVVPTMIMAGDQAFSIVSGHRVALNRSFSSPLVSNLVRYQSEQRYEPRPLQGHDNGAFMRE